MRRQAIPGFGPVGLGVKFLSVSGWFGLVRPGFGGQKGSGVPIRPASARAALTGYTEKKAPMFQKNAGPEKNLFIMRLLRITAYWHEMRVTLILPMRLGRARVWSPGGLTGSPGAQKPRRDPAQGYP